MQATNRAVSALARSNLSPAAGDQAIESVRDLGPSARPASSLSAVDMATVERIFVQSLASAARVALLFAMGVVFIGALLSLLIPRVRPAAKSQEEQSLETFQPFEPMDVDAAHL